MGDLNYLCWFNSTRWALPPRVILAGKKHQSQWYSSIPQDYQISLSENGSATNELGYEWLQELFEKHTTLRTKGRYRLLILDGHSSHSRAGPPYLGMVALSVRGPVLPWHRGAPPENSTCLDVARDTSIIHGCKGWNGRRRQRKRVPGCRSCQMARLFVRILQGSI